MINTEFWHTIYHDNSFQVSNLGRVRATVPATHSEHNYKARLTYEQIILIRHLSNKGATSKSLAHKFGYSHGAVCNIVARRRWKDI